MTQPKQFNQLAEIFEQARALTGEQRASYLHEACADDQVLHKQVIALLNRHDSDGVLDEPIRPADIPSGPMPERIGRFRILDYLGRGGMGVVYRAEQDQPQRQVALKVMHAGLVTEELRRRFEFETSVLARLQHPGIAQIYEVGTRNSASGSQPFFAMELVNGVSLDTYVANENPNLDERLHLMMAICNAVHHAHQKGVIHRDLKPANILVNKEGQPKILDFGVARAVDVDVHTTLQTTPGQIIGTLAYMSPEQVGGVSDRLDTRSDVYALGVIFFELLTGRLPYDVAGKPLTQVAQIISHVSPQSLTSVNRRYRGDLATISAKTLEKDPARRYASVSDMAADLKRYLDCEPIAARPASSIYQLRKFAQRHRALVAGFTTALIALIAGLSMSMYSLRIASTERDENDAVTQFLSEMLSAADPGREGKDAKILDLLSAASQRLDAQALDRPLVAATLHHVIGTTYRSLGIFDAAESHLKQAFEMRNERLGKNAPLSLDSMRELGTVYCHWGRYDESQKLLEHALEGLRQALGRGDARTLAAMSELGSLYRRQGRYDEALALFEKNLELRREYIGMTDPETLTAMNNLGLVYKRMGHFKEAEKLYRETLQTRKRILGSEHFDTLTSMNNLAHLYRSLDRPRESAALHAKTLEIRRRKLGNEHPQTLMSMDNMAMLLADLGKLDESRTLYLEALELKKRVLGEAHPQTFVTMNNLANLYVSEKNYDQAAALHRETLALRQESIGPRHEDTAMSMVNLARVFLRQEKYDEAADLLEQAIDIRKEVLPPDHPDIAYTLHRIGWSRMKQGRYQECAKLYADALKIYEERKDESRESVVLMQTELSLALSSLQKFEEAKSLLEKAYEAVPARPGDDLSDLVFTGFVRLYEKWDKVEPDKGYGQKALEWRRVGKVNAYTVTRP